MSSGSLAQLSVVFDTNVWLAARLRDGLTRAIIPWVTSGSLHVYTTEVLLTELHRTLETKDPLYVDSYVAFVRSLSDVVSDRRATVPASVQSSLRDSSDLPILTAAMAGNVSLIVTIDQDLITLKQVGSIGIVHPKTLVHILGSQS